MGAFISRIYIAGLGFLGCSLALAVKKRKIADSVIGWDISPDNLRIAFDRGAIDFCCEDCSHALKLPPEKNSSPGCSRDMVLVCTPVGSIVPEILRISKILGQNLEKHGKNPPLFITDIGSTKEKICAQLQERLSKNIRYVGSHPIAGSEKSGPEFADPDLFSGRLTVLTPTEKDELSDIALLEHFWNLLGSPVIQIPPGQHDSILARTSHLPHLLSVLLVSCMKNGEQLLLGPGFQSMSRLAAGNPGVWRDIFAENDESVLEAIDAFAEKLENFRELLVSRRFEEIEFLLEKAKKRRDSLKTIE